jgi:arginase family enzyme
VYVALDLDVLDPGDAGVFMPEPNGWSADEVEDVLRAVVARVPIAGIGVTGWLPAQSNVPLASRLLAVAGF